MAKRLKGIKKSKKAGFLHTLPVAYEEDSVEEEKSKIAASHRILGGVILPHKTNVLYLFRYSS